MKVLILAVNLFLAGLLVWEAVRYFDGTPELAVRTERKKKKTVAGQGSAAPQSEMSAEDAVRTIQQKNIFNITRCPDAIGGRGGSSSLALLGIFRIGDKCGANCSFRRVSVSWYGRFCRKVTFF